MSDCNICIGEYGDSGNWDFFNQIIRKARKNHNCCECDRQIIVGQEYEYSAGKWEGDLMDYKTCLDCSNIRKGLVCDGGTYGVGDMWNEIKEVFPDMKTTACLAKIKTPGAKAYLLERWREWKGLDKQPATNPNQL